MAEEFLIQNGALEEWRNAILKDDTARNALSTCMKKYEELTTKYGEKGISPPRQKVLRVLSFVPPSNVRGIIVGHDPLPKKGQASGLAFSSNAPCEEVRQMKEALRQAGIEGEEDKDIYNYEHWARGGILLLNPLLTVRTDDPTSKLKTEHECWLSFTTSITRIAFEKSRHTVLGLFCGDLANEIYNKLQTEDVFENRQHDVTFCHHPTRPCEDKNNFLINSSAFFRKYMFFFKAMKANRLSFFKKEVDFLNKNEVLEEWKSAIFENSLITDVLSKCIAKHEGLTTKYGEQGISPPRQKVLRVLSFVPPSNVRGIIVGHDPLPKKGQASGLAFSSNAPCEEVRRMKKALRQARIEGEEDKDNYNYEHWARGGLLLLNSLLTVKTDDLSSAAKREHEFWLPFTKLVAQVAFQKSRHTVFGLFCGDLANGIYNELQTAGVFENHQHDVTFYQHQTRPCGDSNNFLASVADLFSKYGELYQTLKANRLSVSTREEEFLDQNNVHKEWKMTILEDSLMRSILSACIARYDALVKETKKGFVSPPRRLLLRALSYVSPSEVKGFIVGWGPLLGAKLHASGLAFSCDEHCDQVMWMKIAMRNAGIESEEDENYSYEHWAIGGVLLLNAILSVKAVKEHNSDYQDHKTLLPGGNRITVPNFQKEYNDFWLPFTKLIIQKALERSRHTVCGMFWGNHAKTIYNELNKEGAFVSFHHEISFHDHPPTENDRYRDYRAEEIQMKAFQQYKGFFKALKPERLSALKKEASNFLIENGVQEEWRNAILDDEPAMNSLSKCIAKYEALVKEYGEEGISPPRQKVLRVLSFVSPFEVKGLIVGHCPIPTEGQASGLAFSSDAPCEEVRCMKEALKEAGIEGEEDKDNYNYEHWARGGMLLLNALLTVKTGEFYPELEKDHEFWLPFTKRIAQLAFERSNHSVFGLFYGYYARKLYIDLVREDPSLVDKVSHCEHPERPHEDKVNEKSFFENATRQLSKYKDFFHDLQTGRLPTHAERVVEGKADDAVKQEHKEVQETR